VSGYFIEGEAHSSCTVVEAFSDGAGSISLFTDKI